MNRIRIARLLASETAEPAVLVKGWVRTKRDARAFSFLEVNDGSCLKNIQVIAGEELENYAEIRKLTTGSSLTVSGELVASRGGGQKWEIKAAAVTILQIAPESYPLQKKRHSDEFLRTIAHLRPRTNKYGAAFRIRAELSHAIHTFFHDRGFLYVHTPIITGSDCEGAGEMFRVTTVDPGKIARKKSDDAPPDDLHNDFFAAAANLTVSGQLSAEMLCLALGDVYTFGPTFRAENSNTRRHAAEFWMVEPEMAFCDLAGNMDLGEELIRALVSHIVERCPEDIELFSKFVDKSLMKRLDNIAGSDFIRIPYTEAVDILLSCGKKFDYPVGHGKDLQSEHERYLTEIHFKKPVILHDYPAAIKPFYMRLNNDGHTVAAMDVLVPGIGEIIGGSQREERIDVLERQMAALDLPVDHYWWYLDSRRYGSVEHSGFGLGFERLLMLITGIRNIRDVIPFPRTPGSIAF